MFIKTILKTLGLGIGFVIILTMLSCARKTASDNNLPKDILGISVGMDKNEAHDHLKEIGKLIREEQKNQEVWVLKDGSRFGHLAVGFTKENLVRYVTAIAKPNGETAMKPSEIGSLDNAKQEKDAQNYRYVWEVAAQSKRPAYLITAQGNQPENLSLYTMSASGSDKSSEEEEEREEREEREKRNRP